MQAQKLEERKNDRDRYLKYDQAYYLVQILGLEHEVAQLISQNFKRFTIMDLCALANQNISEKLTNEIVKRRVCFAVDFCYTCLHSSDTRLNMLAKTICTDPRFNFEVETQNLFMQELTCALNYFNRFKQFVSGMPRGDSVKPVRKECPLENFLNIIGLNTELCTPIIKALKEQAATCMNDLEYMHGCDFTEFSTLSTDQKEAIRHVLTLYHMSANASLPSLRDQSTSTTRYFNSEEITEIERYIADRQERLQDLGAYVESIKCGSAGGAAGGVAGGAAGGDDGNFGFLLLGMDAGGAADGATTSSNNRFKDM